MHLVVPASGIFGAMINRGKYVMNSQSWEFAISTRLFLSSFSLTIGMENLGLQNLQRPTTVNVSMQVTAIETLQQSSVNQWGCTSPAYDSGSQVTPWARSVRIPRNTGFEKQIDYNELYVILKPNQGYHYVGTHGSPVYGYAEREKYQIIKVSDIKFDIPEYSAVSRTDSATLNTFTLNGVADAREPVLLGAATESDALSLLFPQMAKNGDQWPRWHDEYAWLQTGDVYLG